MDRNRILFLLQLVHTLIFIAALSTLLPLGWYALTGQGERVAIYVLLVPVAIFIGLMLNQGTCILQSWAKRLTGTQTGWARDILFLPESWALRVVPVMLPVFVVVIAAAGVRWALA
ncbi:MAG: hypothetical protein GYB36_04840 [Alphaproteobacteria bacterium]|nr:hypothetical protein [Alphaproteobacteria bacterium]